MNTQKIILVTIAAVLSALTTPVFAQPEQTDDSANLGGIEEVIVTAQKREQNLQSVPIAITALSAGMLENLGITDMSSLVHAVPSLQYNFSFSNPQWTLRGITNYSNGAWIESGINVYVDGVYSLNNQATIFSLNNIERVEVIKGPQGTLFGRNSLGGVISITTKTPEEPEFDLEIGYGNFDRVSGKLYGAARLSENLSADVAVFAYDQGDGWGTNLYDGSELHTGEEQAIRSKWVYTPSDKTTVTFSGSYDFSAPPVLGIAFVNGVYPFVPIGPLHVGGYWDSYLPFPGILEIETYGGAVTLDHDFGWSEFVSITAMNYSEIEKDSTRPPALPYNPNNPAQGQGTSGFNLSALQFNDTETFTQEFQLKSPGSSDIQWIGGVFFLTDQINNTAYRIDANGSTRYVIDGQDTTSYAGFGQATIPLAEKTRLTLGLRYTRDEKEVDGYGYNADGSIRPGDSVTANPEPSKSWTEPTYTVIVDHDFKDNVMGYASYSRGYQSGSYNISSSVNSRPVEPQTIDAYEIGLKTSSEDNRVRFNSALYYYKIYDLLVSQNIDNTRITSNAAEAEYTGVDVDLSYLPIDNLMLTVAAAYVNPEYSDYRDATFYAPNAAGTAWVATVGDATGNQIAYAEKFSGTISASYIIPTQSGNFTLNGSFNYHDGAPFDPQGLLVQPSYSLINASLIWNSSDSIWRVRLWGNNLSDEKYATFFANTPQMYMNPAAPRTYGISVGYLWN